MTPEQAEILLRLGAALLMGGLIGLERELHGRAAGLRTHMLVCLAATLLMVVPLYPGDWLGLGRGDLVRIDPVRMAQGIMTGIGFLGAGEIFRQGWNVRGLTTAATIWLTAALGIVIGVGMYALAAIATVAALVVLVLLNWFEGRLPIEHHIEGTIRFARGETMDEDALRAFLHGHDFAMRDLSRRLVDSGRAFEYSMILRTREPGAADRLSRALRDMSNVIEFEISPRGD